MPSHGNAFEMPSQCNAFEMPSNRDAFEMPSLANAFEMPSHGHVEDRGRAEDNTSATKTTVYSMIAVTS